MINHDSPNRCIAQVLDYINATGDERRHIEHVLKSAMLHLTIVHTKDHVIAAANAGMGNMAASTKPIPRINNVRRPGRATEAAVKELAQYGNEYYGRA